MRRTETDAVEVIVKGRDSFIVRDLVRDPFVFCESLLRPEVRDEI